MNESTHPRPRPHHIIVSCLRKCTPVNVSPKRRQNGSCWGRWPFSPGLLFQRNSADETEVKLQLPSCLLRREAAWAGKCLISFRPGYEIKSLAASTEQEAAEEPGLRELASTNQRGLSAGDDNEAFLQPMLSSSSGFPLITLIVQLCQQQSFFVLCWHCNIIII